MRETEHNKLCAVEERPERQLEEGLVLKKTEKTGTTGVSADKCMMCRWAAFGDIIIALC